MIDWSIRLSELLEARLEPAKADQIMALLASNSGFQLREGALPGD
jgi:hypothetical protein